jgi:hypothetical protein
LYQKVKRVTIALESKEYPILMASFDIEADHENINKILPMINKKDYRVLVFNKEEGDIAN